MRFGSQFAGTYTDHGDTFGVWVTAEIRNGRLSISGEVWRTFKNGNRRPGAHNCWGCGQCRDELRAITTPAPGRTLEDLRELADIWDRWHGNDMRAGCEHQRAFGWDVMHALSRGRWGRPVMNPARQHAFRRIGRPCLVCGYAYGADWLREELPADVVAFVERFNAV